MNKRLTILDIARLSGVGKSTVSRVINQDPNVHQATRERVETVIREHGFEPSKSARAMRTNSLRLVGIIVSRLDSASENRAVRGMLDTLYQHGYDAMLMESEFSPEKVDEHLSLLARRGVDGVILFAFTGLDLEQLRPWQSKLVLMARAWPDMASVCYDDRGAIRAILQELYDAGKQQIDFLGVDTSDTTTGLLRLQAYQEFCEEHTLPCRYLTGSLSIDSGYTLAEKLVTKTTEALVCATDTLALGAAKYLQHQGYSHITLTGVGNNPMLHFLFPHAASVDPGYKQAGRLAATQLLALLEQATTPQAHIAPAHPFSLKPLHQS